MCFVNDPANTEIYTYLHTLSLHDALPICLLLVDRVELMADEEEQEEIRQEIASADAVRPEKFDVAIHVRGLVNQFGDAVILDHLDVEFLGAQDRKSPRLNSSH